MGQSTTIGNILINSGLPPEMREHNRVLTKTEMTNILSKIGNAYPKQYSTAVQHLKDLGDTHAYLEGSSFSFDDAKPVEVKDIYKKYEPALKKARDVKDVLQRENALRTVNRDTETEINSRVASDMKNKPTRIHLWSIYGGKGNANNMRQMFYASGNQVDVANKVFPYMARNSFAEGLTPSDNLISATGARKGIVGSFISVRDPGAFGKELFMLTNSMVTTEHDCGTHQGVSYPVSSPDTLDRYLAEPAGTFRRNDVITHSVQDNLRRQGVKSIIVRTPLRCQAKEGVCAMCVGLLENGQHSPLGDTIGLRSAQALTEPLTQLALSSKHTGGVVGKKSAFETIKQIMHVPEQFAGGAILAQRSGKVSRIDDAPDGGKRVYVDEDLHYVDPKQQLLVKAGMRLEKGDRISAGLVNPAEIVRLKGMEAGRDHLAKALREVYAENGVQGHPKVFETVARAVLNLGVVKDPGDHDLNIEDYVNWNSSQEMTKPIVRIMHGRDAVGYRLAKELPQLQLAKDSMLTEAHLPVLEKISALPVYKKPAVIDPIMLGTEMAAIQNGDILSNLGFRRVKAQLKENTALGRGVDLHSWRPVSSYIVGSEFGLGHGGRF